MVCRRAVIPGEIFTRFAEFHGIVSVNDFWFPLGFQEVHIWALGLSCETPAAPPDRAAGARTRQPENSKRAHFRAPALQTPPKFNERTPRERKKKENCGGGGKKKREILGPPPFWAPPRGPPFGAPPFGAPPFGAPLFLGLGPPPFGPPTLLGSTLLGSTLRGPTLRGPHTLSSQNSTSKNWPKSKLAEVEIGRSRKSWPKSKLAEVDHPPRLPGPPSLLHATVLHSCAGTSTTPRHLEQRWSSRPPC